MLKHLKHAINLVKHSLRDLGTGKKRSSHWPTLEKHFLKENPTCAACGGKDRLQAHHCKPFHIDPELELDPTNLITLCMGKIECHLFCGHLGNFRRANPNIRSDAAEILQHPEKREEIIAKSMAKYYPELVKK